MTDARNPPIKPAMSDERLAEKRKLALMHSLEKVPLTSSDLEEIESDIGDVDTHIASTGAYENKVMLVSIWMNAVMPLAEVGRLRLREKNRVVQSLADAKYKDYYDRVQAEAKEAGEQ